jgi:LuxR family maltose regulon positive regulatory protein
VRSLYLREGGVLPGAAVSFGGGRLESQYMEWEFLARISSRQRQFLIRTAVLERMSRPPCEAVLGIAGAGAILADLAASNLLQVPLERQSRWSRYRHLFRDMLLAELERLDPELIPVLRPWVVFGRRRPEEALEYSMAAGDADTAARPVQKLRPGDRSQGRIALPALASQSRWRSQPNPDGSLAGPTLMRTV